MPGLIKVGKTKTHPTRRMSELHSTGVPTPFDLEFSAMVSNCELSEKAAHRALTSFRATGNREFFSISVKKALELILPNIGDYRIHDVKETHDIEEICREVDRREREKKEAERIRQETLQRLADRLEAERLANRRGIEQKIAVEEQKLRLLGHRPVQKELPILGYFLMFCYLPIPIGWMFWAGASQVFGEKNHTAGLVFSFLIVAGFIFNEIDKKNKVVFDKVNAPFQEIDNKLYQLRQELEKFNRSHAPTRRLG